MRAIIRNAVTLLHTTLANLNLFSVRDFGSSVDRMTAKRLGQWTTRLYLIVLIIGMTMLVLNTIIQPQILTKTFDKPSFDLYKDLKRIHGDELKCSCSLIASKYDRFVKIEPVFHQVKSIILQKKDFVFIIDLLEFICFQSMAIQFYSLSFL